MYRCEIPYLTNCVRGDGRSRPFPHLVRELLDLRDVEVAVEVFQHLHHALQQHRDLTVLTAADQGPGPSNSHAIKQDKQGARSGAWPGQQPRDQTG